MKVNPPGRTSVGTCFSSSDTATDGRYKTVTSKSFDEDIARCQPFRSSIVPFGEKQYDSINKRERRISELKRYELKSVGSDFVIMPK